MKNVKRGLRNGIVAFVAFYSSQMGQAQVTSSASQHPYECASFMFSMVPYDRIKLSQQGTPELVDLEALHVIGSSLGLSKEEVDSVQVTENHGLFEICRIGKSEKAFRTLAEPLKLYARARSEGHSKEFLLAAITNKTPSRLVPDHDVAVLLIEKPELRADLLKKVDSGFTTNHAGQKLSKTIGYSVVDGKAQTKTNNQVVKQDEVRRWVIYVAVDGEIAWRYAVHFKPDGSLGNIFEDKCDAKEFDPKYKQTIKDVKDEVTVEMKSNKSYGRFGSVHTFWELTREKLKTKGIEWKSPAELNPNIRFD